MIFTRVKQFFRRIASLWRQHPPTQPSTGGASARESNPDPEPTPLPPEPTALVAGSLKDGGFGTVIRLAASELDEREKVRRRLERNRLRYDVLVKPRGPAPVKLPPRPPKPKEKKPKEEILPPLSPARTVLDALPDNDPLIVEEDRLGENVLIAESEMYGEFNFRDTVLDQLDRYFIYLKRMRKHDRDGYEFYRKIGITLLPLAATSMTDVQFRGKSRAEEKPIWQKPPQLPDSFKKNRPAFGCFAWGTNSHLENYEDKEHFWHPRFMYFIKYSEPPPEIQPASGGDVYKMTIWWDTTPDHDPKTAKRLAGGGVPQEYPVFVSRDGNHLRILKMLKTDWVEIISRRKDSDSTHARGLHHFSIPRRAWGIRSDLTRWAKRHGETVETYLINLFCDVVRHCEFADYSMLRVSVHKGDLTAVFGVNIKRVGYFFQDRDIELNEHGTKKRIFHIVRPHKRTLRDGTVKMMPFQFRGQREFEWAGYHVKITVPARDHFPLNEFDIGCLDEYWVDPDQPTLTMSQVADRLIKNMNEGML